MMKYSLLPLAVFLSLPVLLAGADPNTVAVWSFEAGQGDQVLDSSGNGHHGKIVDGAKWNPNGEFGGAIDFDGVGSYLEVPASDAFDLTEFTVELWFRAESINGTRAIFGHGQGPIHCRNKRRRES